MSSAGRPIRVPPPRRAVVAGLTSNASPLLRTARLLSGLAAPLVSPLRNVAFHCTEQQFDNGAEDHQIEQHLYGHEESREVGFGADVAEPDCREHGDREVQGTGVVQL